MKLGCKLNPLQYNTYFPAPRLFMKTPWWVHPTFLEDWEKEIVALQTLKLGENMICKCKKIELPLLKISDKMVPHSCYFLYELFCSISQNKLRWHELPFVMIDMLQMILYNLSSLHCLPSPVPSLFFARTWMFFISNTHGVQSPAETQNSGNNHR